MEISETLLERLKSEIPGMSIYTSVEQIDFIPIENDWINQLAKRIVI